MPRNLAKSFRRSARIISRFCSARRATTAVEFALIAPAFLALLFAIFQTTFYLFAQQNLQNAAVAAGRLIMTGQVQNGSVTQSQFKTNDVCPLLGPMFSCANLFVNVQNYVDFAAANTSAPALTYTSGVVNNTWAYDPGTPGQVMVVQLIYQWPIIAGALQAVLPSISGDSGYTELMGVTAFRVEPY
jgi:Flp pilus assembly protein TadG